MIFIANIAALLGTQKLLLRIECPVVIDLQRGVTDYSS